MSIDATPTSLKSPLLFADLAESKLEASSGFSSSWPSHPEPVS